MGWKQGHAGHGKRLLSRGAVGLLLVALRNLECPELGHHQERLLGLLVKASGILMLHRGPPQQAGDHERHGHHERH